MNFSFINKIFIIFFSVLIISCQDRQISINENKEINNFDHRIEQIETIDFSFNSKVKNKSIDYYSNELVNINFADKKIHKNKVNNYQDKLKNNLTINVIFNKDNLYSINHRGEILKFDTVNYKLIEKYQINFPIINKIPISFSLIDNDFIIGFKSGEVIRVNAIGEIIWSYNNNDLLSTPIKHHDSYLIILYPEDIIILSQVNGNVIFQMNYESNNIIQSTGGQIVNYFNLIYFILPNSEFHSIDTLFFEKHISSLDSIDIITSLNNLSDRIYIYKNFLVYLDNGNLLNTYDIINDEFILSNYNINYNSYFIYNNAFITKNENSIKFFNIKNANLFSKIDVEKILKKQAKIIYVNVLDNKLHLFMDNGELLILSKDFKILEKLNLKINKINKIYNYQDKMFFSTLSGNTYIF